MNDEIEIIECKTTSDYNIGKSITKDYMKWLNMDLCFQNVDAEFKEFKRMYSKPKGSYIYVKYKNKIAGGVGCRKLENNICEMKRLFVYEDMQGLGIGKFLCLKIIKIAKELEYQKMRLDTIEKLDKAILLYQKLGFYNIAKYRENPDPTVRYMELKL